MDNEEMFGDIAKLTNLLYQIRDMQKDSTEFDTNGFVVLTATTDDDMGVDEILDEMKRKYDL